MRATKRAIGFAGMLAASLAVAIPAAAQGTTYSTIERGRYLVNAGDCASCHTDKGGKPYAGGLAVPTPFGVIYSTNITPDRATGIGNWSEQDFYKAMHNGIRRDGKHLYPAFPYPWFTKVSRDDVHAIKAFLDTLPPVRRQNRPTELIWELRSREVMAGWNELYFEEGAFKSDPKKSDQWNRGAYLVEGVGHCGACHTGTNLLGAPKIRDRYKGGEFGEHWYAPGLISNLRDGLGGWSVAEIVEYLKTGANARSAAAGPMAEVVENSTQYLSNDDLNAIAMYLKDLPAETARTTTESTDLDQRARAHGAALYADNCTGCHMENGEGIGEIFPPLKGSSVVQAKLPDTVIHVVLAGARTPATSGKPTAFAMPAFAWKLDNKEAADLVNYIRNAWGNHSPLTNPSTVAKVRQDVEHLADDPLKCPSLPTPCLPAL